MIRDLSRSYEFSSGVSKLDGSKEIRSVRVRMNVLLALMIMVRLSW